MSRTADAAAPIHSMAPGSLIEQRQGPYSYGLTTPAQRWLMRSGWPRAGAVPAELRGPHGAPGDAGARGRRCGNAAPGRSPRATPPAPFSSPAPRTAGGFPSVLHSWSSKMHIGPIPQASKCLVEPSTRIRGFRVLLVVTFRPEFDAPWVGRSYVTALTLNRLAERDISAMIDRVVGNKSLPANIRQDIIERTDGIPLFVEEMTRAVLEAGSEGAAQRTAAAVPLPALAVPASLQASLMARLDRLGPAKEVAQIGGAIGREFSHALLSAVVSKPEHELASSLDRLVHAGLLFRQGVAPHATYLFKHALVQDAAYGTLLREPRRALHARIADTLESQFSDIAENRPELLARHCTEAGIIERAANLWGKAGQRSLERSALIEAAEQLTCALAQFATLPATPALRREQIKLQVALANALMHTKGYAAAETKASFDQARALIEQAEALGEPAEDPLLLYSILYGFFIAKFISFDGDAARALARQFLALAEQQKATAPIMIGHRLLGNTLLCIGDVADGLAHLDHAIALYDPVAHRPLATRFGQDIGVAIQAWRPVALWLLGYPKTALSEAEMALRGARDAGHAGTLMFTLQPTTFTQLWCGNYAAANAQINDLVALAEEKGALIWKMLGTVFRGAALALSGNTPEAVQAISDGITGYRSTEANVWMTWAQSLLALAHAELGEFDDAWRCVKEALAKISTTNERWFEAEANRIAGEIALKSPEPDAAKAAAYFERALSVARKQQAKSWELRAAMSMARLWRDQGKRDEARDLLAPVYGWFTEGFDTLDLKEAKALLDELHP
jgi:predicted ATPase